MRKLATAFLFALLLLVSAGTRQVQAQTVNFCFVNSAPYTIYMRMFSANRNAMWPAGGGSWVLNDRAQHCLLLSCNGGETICYGSSDFGGRNWGVGYNGNLGCSSCCGTCNNGTYSWDLDDY